MKDIARESTGKQQDVGSEKILAGYIASALDLEDQLLSSMYVDYMKQDAWPAAMKKEAIQSIRTYLEILLGDTEKHKRILLSLQDRLDTDAAD